MSSESSGSRGIGFTGMLQVLFIGLKLAGYIDWPWLWVLSPIWISALLVVLLLAIFLIVIWLENRKVKRMARELDRKGVD